MFTKFVTPVAACAAIVALGGPLAFSQRPANSDGARVLNSPQNFMPGGARVLQGDPPALPGAANSQPAFPQGAGPQAADTAPQLNAPFQNAPQQNAPQPFNAQPQFGGAPAGPNFAFPQGHTFGPAPTVAPRAACPYGCDAGYACEYDRQMHGFVGGQAVGQFAQPPVPAGFQCAGGDCPFDAPQPIAPAHYGRP